MCMDSNVVSNMTSNIIVPVPSDLSCAERSTSTRCGVHVHGTSHDATWALLCEKCCELSAPSHPPTSCNQDSHLVTDVLATSSLSLLALLPVCWITVCHWASLFLQPPNAASRICRSWKQLFTSHSRAFFVKCPLRGLFKIASSVSMGWVCFTEWGRKLALLIPFPAPAAESAGPVVFPLVFGRGSCRSQQCGRHSAKARCGRTEALCSLPVPHKCKCDLPSLYLLLAPLLLWRCTTTPSNGPLL